MEQPQEQPQQVKSPRPFVWSYFALLILAIALAGAGAYVAWKFNVWSLAAAGAASVLMVLIAWPIASSLRVLRYEMHSPLEGQLTTMSDTLDQISVLLNLISEQQLLSDRAKSVGFREKERDALRRAIQEEIGKQDYEAALALANEIERGFGYKNEADRFRTEITQRRSDIMRKQINDAVAGIDRHMRAENWGAATREAERLALVFPADEQVQRLPQDIEARRQGHKRQLLESWQDSVNRKDIDGSIEILKRLDPYLTPFEAENMQEAARGVFKEKLQNLRTAFSVAVQDHNWNEAIRIGDEVTRDYPNTQMAREVREMMESLRQRAAGEIPQMAET